MYDFFIPFKTYIFSATFPGLFVFLPLVTAGCPATQTLSQISKSCNIVISSALHSQSRSLTPAGGKANNRIFEEELQLFDEQHNYFEEEDLLLCKIEEA